MKRACVLVGEQLKGLRRAGIAVDAIPDERWCELFEAACRQPLLWQAWNTLVRAMAAAPEKPVAALVAANHLGTAPPRWQEGVRAAVADAGTNLYKRASPARAGSQPLFRFAMGLAMRELRGRVPALDVAAAVNTEIAAR